MELALLVNEPSDLQALGSLEGVQPDRIYFGNEFCERLTMTEAQLDAAILAAQSGGLALSVVFPYVGPQRKAVVDRLLARLAERAPGTEVIANDWGVLRAAAHQEVLLPVMGRCLNRSLVDPRLPEYVGGALPSGALAALRGSALDSDAFEALLGRYRVERVELDVSPLGMDSAVRQCRVRASIHFPYAFVASGRICLFAAKGRDAKDVGDQFTPGPCQYECRDYEVKLTAPAALAGRSNLVQRGNTVFIQHEPSGAHAVSDVMGRMADYGDRLVWALSAPMGGGPLA